MSEEGKEGEGKGGREGAGVGARRKDLNKSCVREGSVGLFEWVKYQPNKSRKCDISACLLVSESLIDRSINVGSPCNFSFPRWFPHFVYARVERILSTTISPQQCGEQWLCSFRFHRSELQRDRDDPREVPEEPEAFGCDAAAIYGVGLEQQLGASLRHEEDL